MLPIEIDMHKPRDAIIAITHRCNAHCSMCNIWRSDRHDAIMPEHMDNLPSELGTINITGGEPFIRNDIVEFVAHCRHRCPNATITISTNGLLVERINASLSELLKADPRLRIAISLDGIGKAHDEIRGVEGAFDKVRQIVETLGRHGFAGMRLSMTISDKNITDLAGVWDFARAHHLELGIVAAHAGATHLNIDTVELPSTNIETRNDINKIMWDLLKSWRVKNWLRAHFLRGTYLRLIGQEEPLRCGGGSYFFFVQADGGVYSCSMCGRHMGNLTSQPWRDIWCGPDAAQARKFVAGCTKACWMICTARCIYRRKALSIGAWLVAAKIASHLGISSLPKLPTGNRDGGGQSCE